MPGPFRRFLCWLGVCAGHVHHDDAMGPYWMCDFCGRVER